MRTSKTAQAESNITMIAGTAQIEPQFVVNRWNKKFVTAPTYPKLHTALDQAEEAEESIVGVQAHYDCYPLDGIVALNKALDREFGFTHAQGHKGGMFSGPKPPQRVTIEVAFGKFETFAYGQLQPPSWEGGYITMAVDPQNCMSLQVYGQIKRKFEPSMQKVIASAKDILKKESIYRGAAVELDLKFIDKVEEGDGFNPDYCAPKFIDVSKEHKLILPRDLEFLLRARIWGPIRNPGRYAANGIEFKSGFLLSGRYGTGKSLISAVTAKVTADAGSTYMYLKTPRRFREAYRLAKLLGPSVLFCEDVDDIFGGKRDGEMNSILETLDGVGSKGSEVMTIFTSNFPEKINAAFMRTGRVDKHIQLRELDADAAGRFVKEFCSDVCAPDVDFNVVGEAFAGLVPADITGGVKEAKTYALDALPDGESVNGRITTQMLVDAGEVMRRERGVQPPTDSEAEVALALVRKAHDIVAHGNGEAGTANGVLPMPPVHAVRR